MDRINLINQINQQIQGVLSQGVLTRQMTMAQTKGQQVENIEWQSQTQIDTINEQISAAQYQVQAANQVFNLATTRVGLETQLLTLQNQQTDLDMSRIAALQNLVSTLQSGNMGPIIALLQSVPGTTNAAVGVSSTTADTSALEALFASAYSNRASLGYGTYSGQNL